MKLVIIGIVVAFLAIMVVTWVAAEMANPVMLPAPEGFQEPVKNAP